MIASIDELQGKSLILYGTGLIAVEFYRYVSRHVSDCRVCCAAVTDTAGQTIAWQGLSVLDIETAIRCYPAAEICVVLQEKYHEEVLSRLAELQQSAVIVWGLYEMTQQLRQEGLKQLAAACPKLLARLDEYDFSMLDIRECVRPGLGYKLYVMTQVPLSPVALACLNDGRLQAEFTAHFGQRYVSNMRKGAPCQAAQHLCIGMAFSSRDAKIGQQLRLPFVQPIYVGAALQEPVVGSSGLRDDTGENISRWNRMYSELTAAYWLWKNKRDAEYLGLCHYRRHFLLTGSVLRAMETGRVDVLLTTPRLTFPDLQSYYIDSPLTTLRTADYALLLGALRHHDPACVTCAEQLLAGHLLCPNNMVIARREIFSAYCQWLFAILERMRVDAQTAGRELGDGFLGYAGELLMTIFFAYHHAEYKIMYVDYALWQ